MVFESWFHCTWCIIRLTHAFHRVVGQLRLLNRVNRKVSVIAKAHINRSRTELHFYAVLSLYLFKSVSGSVNSASGDTPYLYAPHFAPFADIEIGAVTLTCPNTIHIVEQ